MADELDEMLKMKDLLADESDKLSRSERKLEELISILSEYAISNGKKGPDNVYDAGKILDVYVILYHEPYEGTDRLALFVDGADGKREEVLRVSYRHGGYGNRFDYMVENYTDGPWRQGLDRLVSSITVVKGIVDYKRRNEEMKKRLGGFR